MNFMLGRVTEIGRKGGGLWPAHQKPESVVQWKKSG
jgi:hypothetical protein